MAIGKPIVCRKSLPRNTFADRSFQTDDLRIITAVKFETTISLSILDLLQDFALM